MLTATANTTVQYAPTVLIGEENMTLMDILDLDLRTKITRLLTIFVNKPVGTLYHALVTKKRNFEDASDFLSDLDDMEELSKLSRSDLAKRVARTATGLENARSGLQSGSTLSTISSVVSDAGTALLMHKKPPLAQ